MHYSVNNGGKRIRPFLVYASCQALNTSIEPATGSACAVELMHAYSLVHDDLPCMDDDELRRGKPTTHIAFSEADAVLAGDALQSLAFDALLKAQMSPLTPEIRLQMMQVLINAVGANGMVGGQSIDINSINKTLSLNDLEQMHRYKTGALIEACVKLGALASGQAHTENMTALTHYAQYIGLAYQVKDDILDVESTTLTLGKTQGKDKANNKPTYPLLIGLDNSKIYVQNLYLQAIDSLNSFDQSAEPLRLLARYILDRSY
ncbi:UNVERIFIED_CONTAM: hypothetical protein GTU68_041418 [Idotea baltica]|nr:hypothetical protein [Idotea baltica]